jgi:hypothetical protein
MAMSTPRYQELKEDPDGDEFQEKHSARTLPNLVTRNWLSVLIGVAVGFILGFVTSFIISIEPNDKCTRKMSTWSPALQIYDDQLSIQRFNGALRAPNKYRGPPSQDIDDAWDKLLYPEGGLVRLTKDQLDKINASKYAAEYTQDMGGGYIAGIEVFHQLHCVNMLRKATYMEYYLPKMDEWKDSKTLRYHLG